LPKSTKDAKLTRRQWVPLLRSNARAQRSQIDSRREEVRDARTHKMLVDHEPVLAAMREGVE